MIKSIRIIIAVLCSLVVISGIFFFSEQSGGQSHAESGKVAEIIAKAITAPVRDNYSDKEIKVLVKALDYPVRKLAHLSIYFCLGLVSYLSMLFIWKGERKQIFILVCIGIVIVVAATDEINQFYKDGRGASVTDVFIDTVGGILGIYFYYFITDFVRHLKSLLHYKEKKNDENSAAGDEKSPVQGGRY